MDASSNPGSFTTAAFYDAVEGLKDRAADAHTRLVSSGDLVALRDEMGYIRDRADSIQSAVIGYIMAIETYL